MYTRYGVSYRKIEVWTGGTFNLNIGIVGCGLIGQKRAASLGNNLLKAVADVSLDRAQKLACCYKDVKAFSDWRNLQIDFMQRLRSSIPS